jgi:hypothetical protein
VVCIRSGSNEGDIGEAGCSTRHCLAFSETIAEPKNTLLMPNLQES